MNHHLLLRIAARVEQEIRAYPRLYAAFYGALYRNNRLRIFVGRTKAGVRWDVAAKRAPCVEEPELLRALREETVARRLGLRL